MKFSVWISLVALFLWGCASEMKRGSEKTLYTVGGTLQVGRGDLGKDIQLTLNQKLFFNMDQDPERPGRWELVDYETRILLMQSDSPRTDPGCWGILFEARGLGRGEVRLRFISADEGLPPREVVFDVLVRR